MRAVVAKRDMFEYIFGKQQEQAGKELNLYLKAVEILRNDPNAPKIMVIRNDTNGTELEITALILMISAISSAYTIARNTEQIEFNFGLACNLAKVHFYEDFLDQFLSLDELGNLSIRDLIMQINSQPEFHVTEQSRLNPMAALRFTHTPAPIDSLF